MSANKIWTLAVWMEERQEEEGVIPTCWIKNKNVMWPKGVNSFRAMKNMIPPDDRWLAFPLIKIKHQSNKKNECDNYDYTTTADISDTELDTTTPGKRKPKKRLFSDFITGNSSSQPAAEDSEGEERPAKNPKTGLMTILPTVPKKVTPNPRLVEELPTRVSSPSPPSSPESTLQERRCSRELQVNTNRTTPADSANRIHVHSASRGSTSSTKTPSSVSSLSPRGDREQHSEASRQNVFPMSEARFQRRVLFLLSDIRNSLNEMQRNPVSEQPELNNAGEKIQIPQATTMDEFLSLESKLDQDKYQKFVVSSLQKIGGFTFKENMKNGISRFMTNALMARMNMQGTGEKFGFKSSKLCSLIVDTITKTYKDATQDIIIKEMAKYFKNAPGRCGGGGRT